MSKKESLSSNLLIYAQNQESSNVLKQFCHDNKLTALRPSDINALGVLDGNTGLGAIIIDHDISINNLSNEATVRVIHEKRPELPIYYLRQANSAAEDLPASLTNLIAGSFAVSNLDELKSHLDESIFSNYYPAPFIKGIQEISVNAFSSVIQDCRITSDAPYLIKDSVIYGELLSLIPIESDWCRGFLMLQTTRKEMGELIKNNRTAIDGDNVNFREIKELLNELTNLIWGNMKSKFFQQESEQANVTLTQVPIIIDHFEKNINFGTTEPQLCFQYHVTDDEKCINVSILQKFVFNLNWNPALFKEAEEDLDGLIDKGELELF